MLLCYQTGGDAMKRTLFLLLALTLAVVAAKAQDAPPVVPCGLGQADNIPCYDTKAGKVIHTESQMALPHQDLTNPLPSANTSVAPVTVPKIEVPSSASAGASIRSVQPIPYWTFGGDSAYFHDGNQTQQVDIKKLQTVVRPSQNFANGEVIGQGIGGLIAKWLVHRRQAKLERKDIKQQIIAYYDATLGVDQELQRNLKGIEIYSDSLVLLNPAKQHEYQELKESAITLEVAFAKLPPMLSKDRPLILAAKDMGFLRGMLTNAKHFYSILLAADQKEYAVWQVTGVMVSYYKWQQTHSR